MFSARKDLKIIGSLAVTGFGHVFNMSITSLQVVLTLNELLGYKHSQAEKSDSTTGNDNA
ncbi:hypothetical protein Pcaca05_37690 [Pectobacterium carotovorum subsp. carotovorum]|nr:hypothetical protein Pcaca05_37690 [Pectobacterium carotovorum subsp. carotovorum]